jgi:hypothetical protein
MPVKGREDHVPVKCLGGDSIGVRFNTTACIADLRLHVITTLKILQEEYLRDAQSHMLTPEGKESLHADEIEVLGTFLTANVIGGAYAAMDNFGSGSKMDLINPALEGYRNSRHWNPRRHDERIVGRPEGKYTNIFGEEQYSSGVMAGLDLEYLDEQGALPFDLHVRPPSHALETAARWLKETSLQAIWQESLRAFPWGRFFVVTKD